MSVNSANCLANAQFSYQNNQMSMLNNQQALVHFLQMRNNNLNALQQQQIPMFIQNGNVPLDIQSQVSMINNQSLNQMRIVTNNISPQNYHNVTQYNNFNPQQKQQNQIVNPQFMQRPQNNLQLNSNQQRTIQSNPPPAGISSAISSPVPQHIVCNQPIQNMQQSIINPTNIINPNIQQKQLPFTMQKIFPNQENEKNSMSTYNIITRVFKDNKIPITQDMLTDNDSSIEICMDNEFSDLDNDTEFNSLPKNMKTSSINMKSQNTLNEQGSSEEDDDSGIPSFLKPVETKISKNIGKCIIKDIMKEKIEAKKKEIAFLESKKKLILDERVKRKNNNSIFSDTRPDEVIFYSPNLNGTSLNSREVNLENEENEKITLIDNKIFNLNCEKGLIERNIISTQKIQETGDRFSVGSRYPAIFKTSNDSLMDIMKVLSEQYMLSQPTNISPHSDIQFTEQPEKNEQSEEEAKKLQKIFLTPKNKKSLKTQKENKFINKGGYSLNDITS